MQLINAVLHLDQNKTLLSHQKQLFVSFSVNTNPTNLKGLGMSVLVGIFSPQQDIKTCLSLSHTHKAFTWVLTSY